MIFLVYRLSILLTSGGLEEFISLTAAALACAVIRAIGSYTNKSTFYLECSSGFYICG